MSDIKLQLKSQASWPLFVQGHMLLAKLPCLVICRASWLVLVKLKPNEGEVLHFEHNLNDRVRS